MNYKKLSPELVTVLIIAVLALCYPLVQYGLRFVPPFLFSALRTGIAGLSILLVLPFIKQPVFPPKGTWKWAIFLSIPAVIITYGTMFLSHINPNMTAVPVLENLQPFLGVFLAAAVLHEKISPTTKTVLIYGTVGIALLSLQALLGGLGLSAYSAILAFMAALSASVASVIAKYMKLPNAIVTISAWQFIIGTVPLFIISRLYERDALIRITPSFLGILLFLAIIATAAATVVWYLILQKSSVAKLSVLYFLSPAFGLIIANLAYDNPLNLLEWLAILSIVWGVVVGVKKQTNSR